MGWSFFKASGARRLSAFDTMDPGLMMMWPGPLTTIPTGWLYCNGQAVSKSIYNALYNALGGDAVYGSGGTTFTVPNYIDRVPMGVGSAVAREGIGGSMTHSHTFTIPDHRHDVQLASHVHNMDHHHFMGHYHDFWVNSGTSMGAGHVTLNVAVGNQATADYAGHTHISTGSTGTSRSAGVDKPWTHYISEAGENVYTSGPSSLPTMTSGNAYSPAGWNGPGGTTSAPTGGVHSHLPPVRGVHFIIKT